MRTAQTGTQIVASGAAVRKRRKWQGVFLDSVDIANRALPRRHVRHIAPRQRGRSDPGALRVEPHDPLVQRRFFLSRRHAGHELSQTPALQGTGTTGVRSGMASQRPRCACTDRTVRSDLKIKLHAHTERLAPFAPNKDTIGQITGALSEATLSDPADADDLIRTFNTAIKSLDGPGSTCPRRRRKGDRRTRRR